MESVIDRIGELLSQLQAPDYFAREEAVKELGLYTEDEAVAGLVLAIEDPDLGIRELAADFLSKLSGETAVSLLIRFLGHDDIGTRNLASEILVKIGPDAVLPLIGYLDTDDHDVRKFICDILGLIGDVRALDALCQRLWDDNNNVVCSAAEALGEIGSCDAVTHLIGAYEKIEDVRLQAVEALGKIGAPESLDNLYEYAQSDDPMIKYAAVEAIGSIGKADSVCKLVPILQSSDHLIAEAAMMAVIRIHEKVKGRIDCDLPLADFQDFLFEGVKNKNPEVTRFTLARLRHWYGNDVLTGLLNVVDYVDDETLAEVTDILTQVGPAAGRFITRKLASASSGLKVKLLDVLKQFIDEDMAAEILDLAKDADHEVRQRVAHLLGLSGYGGAVEALQLLAGDPIGHVRCAAYSSFGWVCNEDDAEFIFRGLDDQFPDVREAAMGALIIIGGQDVVRKFTEDLNHSDPERQRLAVTALGWIGEDDVVEPLLSAINNPDPSIRRSAINSLARIGQIQNTRPIVMALSDENSAVRKAAVSALLSLEGEDAVADVRILLEDEDVWVRYHTISSLGETCGRRHSDVIMPYLEDEQDIIKIATAKALAQMGNRDALPALERLRREKNKDLVQAAEMALERIGGRAK